MKKLLTWKKLAYIKKKIDLDIFETVSDYIFLLTYCYVAMLKIFKFINQQTRFRSDVRFNYLNQFCIFMSNVQRFDLNYE